MFSFVVAHLRKSFANEMTSETFRKGHIPLDVRCDEKTTFCVSGQFRRRDA